MPRPLRDASPGVHHVTVGATGYEAYFGDANDRMLWLRRLVLVLDRYRWACVLMCQLTTHVHLIVDVPDNSLPRGMHALNSVYSRDFNADHGRRGYLIRARGKRVVWAPEFFRFPVWATNATLMFAEAAGWNRPIWFRGGVGGHLDVLAVADAARRRGVQRLVFAHIGRPTLKAIARGQTPPFGEFGADGRRYVVGRRPGIRRTFTVS